MPALTPQNTANGVANARLGFLGSESKFAGPSARPQGALPGGAAKLASDPNNPLRLAGGLFGRPFGHAQFPLSL